MIEKLDLRILWTAGNPRRPIGVDVHSSAGLVGVLTAAQVEACCRALAPDGAMSETLFIDILSAPHDWDSAVLALGITVERIDHQPMADQVKLHGCRNAPDVLPSWIRRPKR